MRTGAIIFSRMTSKRLPGKAMMQISGKTLLERVIERTEQLKNIEHFCIATSNNEEDDKIALFAKQNQINLYRGNLNNVIHRALEAAKKYRYDSFLRICGDRPFFDLDIYDKMISVHKNGKYDLTTNIFPRTVPPGLTGEIIDVKSLGKVLKSTSDILDEEHVTRYYYNNSEKFKIFNCDFSHKKENLKLRLVVDDMDDLKRARWISSNLEENENVRVNKEKIISLAKDWQYINLKN